MRELGVTRLIASCLNDACRHVALIDVSKYPADTEVPSFRSRGLRQVRRPGGLILGQPMKKTLFSRRLNASRCRLPCRTD